MSCRPPWGSLRRWWRSSGRQRCSSGVGDVCGPCRRFLPPRGPPTVSSTSRNANVLRRVRRDRIVAQEYVFVLAGRFPIVGFGSIVEIVRITGLTRAMTSMPEPSRQPHLVLFLYSIIRLMRIGLGVRVDSVLKCESSPFSAENSHRRHRLPRSVTRLPDTGVAVVRIDATARRCLGFGSPREVHEEKPSGSNHD